MEITKLKKNEIFVFGSNANGAHAGGAAFTAFKKFGAEMGVGEGPTGKCYAIPTLDKNMEKVSLAVLKKSVNRFLSHAKATPDKTFLLTPIGTGIAGFTHDEVRPLFSKVPKNVVLPEEWVEKSGKRLWKFLREGMRSQHGSTTWKVGEWKKEGNISICNRGFHASNRIGQALSYVQGEILAEVEVRGESAVENDKEVWSEMRVVKAYKWQKKDSMALAIFAAEQVIDTFEKEYPNDKRPREAIEAAKRYVENPTDENMMAAEAAAKAAWAAEAEAARAAAEAAWAACSAEAGNIILLLGVRLLVTSHRGEDPSKDAETARLVAAVEKA